MLDFRAIRSGATTLAQLVVNLSPSDLRRMTNDMVDTMQSLIANCSDDDVLFLPEEHMRNPHIASDSPEQPWTLARVIMHTTAGAEEAAFLAAELARGVQPERYTSCWEVPWQEITTIKQCWRRLEESRRMRLASMDMWPDPPHLSNSTTLPDVDGPVNAIARFVLGLMSDDEHLDQIAEIVREAHLTH